MDKSLGDVVKNMRVFSRMSQVTLADKVGVSQATISEYELSKSLIPLDMLEKIANAVGYKIEICIKKGNEKAIIHVDYQ